MESISVVTSKLDLDNHLLRFSEEITNVLSENRGRDSNRISKITPYIFITGINDIIKVPYSADFHQNVIVNLKNNGINLIVKIGKIITSQQIKRFNAKGIDVQFLENYKNTDIEKIYNDMLHLYVTIKDKKTLFVCDDGSSYGAYVVLLYLLYLSYITKINNMDKFALLKNVDINHFVSPKILEFIMIEKKDILENRVYLSHIFNFEMNLKFYATQKIYDKMREEKFDEENIDYSEISSYKSLMVNVKLYLKTKKEAVQKIEDVENQIEENEQEPSDLIEEKIEEVCDNRNINLDIRVPRDKDTDLSIIYYLF
jgi:hypothetical protein